MKNIRLVPIDNTDKQQVEVRCDCCKEWMTEDDAVWINPNTLEASTGDSALPYHVKCAPEQY